MCNTSLEGRSLEVISLRGVARVLKVAGHNQDP